MLSAKYIITNYDGELNRLPEFITEPFDSLRSCANLKVAEGCSTFVARPKADTDPKLLLSILKSEELCTETVDVPGCGPVEVIDFYKAVEFLQKEFGEDFDPDETFEFASEFVLTSEDVQRMIDIEREKAELSEEFDRLKAKVLQDAELFSNGSLFSMYEVGTDDGTITVTDKFTLDLVSAKKLAEILKDNGDIIETVVSYKVSKDFQKLFVDLYRGLVGERTSTEFFEDLYREHAEKYYAAKGKSGDFESFCKQMRVQLKKDFRKNVQVFKKLFVDLKTDECVALAEEYYKSLVRDDYNKFFLLAGVDLNDKTEVSKLQAMVQATYCVTPGTAFSIKPKK